MANEWTPATRDEAAKAKQQGARVRRVANGFEVLMPEEKRKTQTPATTKRTESRGEEG